MDYNFKVLKFIETLRSSDDYIKVIYTNGGCYQFYLILRNVFYGAIPYLVDEGNHIVTKLYGSYYDITGEVEYPEYVELSREDIDKYKNLKFSNNKVITKMCPHCKEDIMLPLIK